MSKIAMPRPKYVPKRVTTLLPRLTPLNTLVGEILMQIMNDLDLRWPERMKLPPNRQPHDKYCRFHRDQEHNIDDCFDCEGPLKVEAR
jgi:hypothetical protein